MVDSRQSPHLSLQRIPTLRNPILILAFEGWNDSGEAATTAAQVLVSDWDGTRFASIDPEEFFVFTETRPHVRLNRRGRRRIDWPANEFYACIDPDPSPDAHDLVVLLGTEPDLRWRTFSDIVLDVARRAGVQLVVGLGAFESDVPHTMPPVVTSTASNPELHALLKGLGFKSSKYEGATGIITVLTTRFAAAGYPTLNLWGHSPHYISASPNPVVASRIVHELLKILHVTMDTEQLDENAARFDEQVREAVSKDPEAMAYVRDLERRQREGGDEPEDRPTASELPHADAVVNYLEEFLRTQRKNPPSE
ncbi:MAG TPA: PAC2 family protein [Chloroflexota bacterium]|nr:PAC2 family protein [Chloroflexota bacterium]